MAAPLKNGKIELVSVTKQYTPAAPRRWRISI